LGSVDSKKLLRERGRKPKIRMGSVDSRKLPREKGTKNKNGERRSQEAS
jgi:hypothetical protein